jgi:hypothetical protein
VEYADPFDMLNPGVMVLNAEFEKGSRKVVKTIKTGSPQGPPVFRFPITSPPLK